jgi:hypothetical protein
MNFDAINIDQLLHEYLDALHDRCAEHYADKYPNLTPPAFGYEVGNKYIRVYQESGNSRHVHAFLDRSTGDVIKAGGWKAPQRGKNGLAVRYRLADPASKARCFASIDPYGSYLYA